MEKMPGLPSYPVLCIVEKAKEFGLSETIDQKGNLVYYTPWKFTISGNNTDLVKLSKSPLHESIQIFFYRELKSFEETHGFNNMSTEAAYKATLTPSDDISSTMRWRITEIVEIRDTLIRE